MKRHHILTLLLLPSFASAFQTEMGATLTRVDFEDDDQFTGASISVQHHFSPVDIKNHPHIEAAFLEKSSSIAAEFGRIEFELSTGESSDGSIYGANIILMKKDSIYFVDAGFIYAEYESNRSPFREVEFDTYYIDPGIFINDKTLVNFHYETNEVEFTSTSIEGTEVGLAFKSVSVKSNLEGSINRITEESSTNSEDFESTIISISGDFFFNQKTSIGVGISNNSSDVISDEGDTLSIRSTIFINEKVGFGFEYEKFSADNGDDDNSLTFTGGIRF